MYSQCCLFTFTKYHALKVGYSGCLDVHVLQNFSGRKGTAHQAVNDSCF